MRRDDVVPRAKIPAAPVADKLHQECNERWQGYKLSARSSASRDARARYGRARHAQAHSALPADAPHRPSRTAK